MGSASGTACAPSDGLRAYALRPETVRAAQAQAKLAARRKAHLFRAFPAVSREDLVQEAMYWILRANYDVSKASWATFAYNVARRRIIDYYRACACRPMLTGLGDGDRVVGPRLTGTLTLEQAAREIDRPMAGARGRPWKEPLDIRLAMHQRRLDGKSWGEIAREFKVTRERVRQIVERLGKKLGEGCGINGAGDEGQRGHRRRRGRRERITG